jgi:hypothetical protein
VQIARRRRAHQEKNPDAKIISLGIGDTTEPIPPAIVTAMRDAAEGLGTLTGYSGCVGLSLVGTAAGLPGAASSCAPGSARGFVGQLKKSTCFRRACR